MVHGLQTASSAVNAQKVAQRFGTVNDNNQERQSEGRLERPNGVAFSCCERAAEYLQKTTDLAREAAGWNTLLGGCLVLRKPGKG